MGLLSAVGSIGALGPSLVRTSARTSWGLGRSTASVASRAAHRVAGAAVAAPVVVAQAAVALLDAEPKRRVWAADGRAQVEVWGLDSAVCPAVVAAVQNALCAQDGVTWARVDVVTRRAVLRFDPARLAVADLVGTVAAVEAGCGVTVAGYRHDEASFPGDGEPVTVQAWAFAADLVGLSTAVAGRLVRLPSLPGSAAAAVVLVDNQPRVRRVLEARLGPATTDLTLAVATAAVQGLTQGVPSLLVDSGQRAAGTGDAGGSGAAGCLFRAGGATGRW